MVWREYSGGWPGGLDLMTWAYDAAADAEPLGQDSDIIVAGETVPALLVRLVADPRCPRRRFFLACLYILSGDALQGEADRPRLTEALVAADAEDDRWLKTWALRTRALFNDPASFDYEAWTHGAWSEGSLAARPEG